MTDARTLKRQYRWTGFSYLVLLIVTFGLQILIQLILQDRGVNVSDNTTLLMYVSELPMWLVGMPAAAFMMKKLVIKKEPEWKKQDRFTEDDSKVTFGRFVKWFFIAIFLMEAGNIIGLNIANTLNQVTTLELENNTVSLLQDLDIWTDFILAGIIGPIIEELMFRKVLIDGLGRYSKKTAIILSGVMFGLFHMNIYQIFYAALLGMLLAFIYVKTGKIWYTILLHILLNNFQGVLPLIMLKGLDLEKLESLTASAESNMTELISFMMNPSFLLYLVYVLLIFIFAIIGGVIFIINGKKFFLMEEDADLKAAGVFKTVYLNAGILLFMIATIVLTFVQ